jgi:hypothetical protein
MTCSDDAMFTAQNNLNRAFKKLEMHNRATMWPNHSVDYSVIRMSRVRPFVTKSKKAMTLHRLKCMDSIEWTITDNQVLNSYK